MKTLGYLFLVVVLLGGCTESGGGGGDAGNGDTAPPSAGEAQNLAQAGEEVYNRFCFSCHAGGVAGAPRPGDSEAWAPRIAKGRELLLKSVRDGMPPGMPPMGLCMSCSDAELNAAIEHMLAQ